MYSRMLFLLNTKQPRYIAFICIWVGLEYVCDNQLLMIITTAENMGMGKDIGNLAINFFFYKIFLKYV